MKKNEKEEINRTLPNPDTPEKIKITGPITNNKVKACRSRGDAAPAVKRLEVFGVRYAEKPEHTPTYLCRIGQRRYYFERIALFGTRPF
jgi:hypothetical protein